MVETERLLWANRPSLRQPSARGAGREPELAAGADGAELDGRLWKRRIRVRAIRQRGVLGRSRVSPGWPEGSRGAGVGRKARPGPWSSESHVGWV